MERECQETAESLRYRAEWTRQCLLATASRDKTAPQMEQQEDLVDKCKDASSEFKQLNCKMIPTFRSSMGSERFRDCASAIPGSEEDLACERLIEQAQERR